MSKRRETSSSAAMSRRRFLGLVGAATAGASVAGCVRKPAETIVPLGQRPEFLVPGHPLQYASVMRAGQSVVGVLVTAQDGRPSRVEGNPRHPINGDWAARRGAANAWMQASVLGLYDPDRSTQILRKGEPATWADFVGALSGLLDQAGAGAKLGIVLPWRPSPTVDRLLDAVAKKFPGVHIYAHDPGYPWLRDDALALLGMRDTGVLYDVDKADVVVSIDADFLHTEGDALRNARLLAQRRDPDGALDALSRLYVVEPSMTVTGMAADNRRAVPASQMGAFLGALAAELTKQGIRWPQGADALVAAASKGAKDDFGKWPAVVAKDLLAHRGRSLVVVGYRQPPAVQALGHCINEALGNTGKTVRFVESRWPRGKRVADLAADAKAGKLDILIDLGANPAYGAPADLDLPSALGKVQHVVHLGSHLDETAALAEWHVPMAHWLEAWGDLVATDGTASIQQPLIAPLYDAYSDVEILAVVAGEKGSAHDIVRATWADEARGEKAWRRALHDGYVTKATAAARKPAGMASGWAAAAKAWPAPPKPGVQELVLTWDATIFDGRWANNPWLVELPDPVTKLSWDNALCLAPKTAKALGLEDGDLVEVSVGGHKVEAAVFALFGTHPNTAVLSLGWGRKIGRFARGAGFDGYALQTTAAPHIATGVGLAPTGKKYELANVQEWPSMEDGRGHHRPTVRRATAEEFHKEPNFVEKFEVTEKEEIRSLLFDEPPLTGQQQWGMTIDLSKCIGCAACTVACQAENNIAFAGKERMGYGREMHWIRIDRYFVPLEPLAEPNEAPAADPRETLADDPHVLAVAQPMACAQCETAPCETVCPVAATSHSPEGLNDMAYNRCIGTRYCSNNCPYKVRHFNFFNFSKENDEAFPLLRLQRNQNVTVRFRGVMEKCTYCVQRIEAARIAQRRKGVDHIPEGMVVPACQASCPTDAITFGDVRDPNTRVSKRKKSPRNYAVLSWLNIRPRTTYLAQIRNPNPELTG